jgi:hypothetical protein
VRLRLEARRRSAFAILADWGLAMSPMSSFSTWSTLINYVPLQAPLLQLVFAENGAAVDSVMIGGRMVLEHGRLLTIDESKLKHDT